MVNHAAQSRSVRLSDQDREDLVSDLVHASENDEKLSEDDVVSLVTGLIAAGSETTALGGLALIST